MHYSIDSGTYQMTTGARDQMVSIQIAYDKTIAPVTMNEIQADSMFSHFC